MGWVSHVGSLLPRGRPLAELPVRTKLGRWRVAATELPLRGQLSRSARARRPRVVRLPRDVARPRPPPSRARAPRGRWASRRRRCSLSPHHQDDIRSHDLSPIPIYALYARALSSIHALARRPFPNQINNFLHDLCLLVPYTNTTTQDHQRGWGPHLVVMCARTHDTMLMGCGHREQVSAHESGPEHGTPTLFSVVGAVDLKVTRADGTPKPKPPRPGVCDTCAALRPRYQICRPGPISVRPTPTLPRRSAGWLCCPACFSDRPFLTFKERNGIQSSTDAWDWERVPIIVPVPVPF